VQVVFAPGELRQWWDRVSRVVLTRPKDSPPADPIDEPNSEAAGAATYTVDELLEAESTPLPLWTPQLSRWTVGHRKDAVMAAVLSLAVLGAVIGSTFESSPRYAASSPNPAQSASSQSGTPNGSRSSSPLGSSPTPSTPFSGTNGTSSAKSSSRGSSSAGTPFSSSAPGATPTTPGPASGSSPTTPAPNSPSSPTTPAAPSSPGPAGAGSPGSPGPLSASMSSWVSANELTVAAIALDLEVMQTDLGIAVSSNDFSSLGSDCTSLTLDASFAQPSLPVPDPTYQSIWSTVLNQAPSIAAACTAAASSESVDQAQATLTDVNSAVTTLQPLANLLPRQLLGIVPGADLPNEPGALAQTSPVPSPPRPSAAVGSRPSR
jgi:hypothetical protein